MMQQTALNLVQDDQYLEITRFSLNNKAKKGQKRQAEAWGPMMEGGVYPRVPGFLEFRSDGAFHVVLTERKPQAKGRRSNKSSAYGSYRVTVKPGDPMWGRDSIKQTEDLVLLDGPGRWYKLRMDLRSDELVRVPFPPAEEMTRSDLKDYIKQLVDLA